MGYPYEPNIGSISKTNKQSTAKNQEIVTLNIGGQLFDTSRKLLIEKISKPNRPDKFYPNHYYQNLFQQQTAKDESNNLLFSDRNPAYFAYVLDYLRSVHYKTRFRLPASQYDLEGLLIEADTLNMQGLKEIVTQHLKFSHISSSILTHQQIANLTRMGTLSVHAQWDLLYRASRDGFTAESFHKRSGDMKHTLTVVRSSNGYVFGGYYDSPCNSTSVLIEDMSLKGFMFGFDRYVEPTCLVKWISNTVRCLHGYGPVFGDNYEIVIANNSNNNQESYSSLIYSPILADNEDAQIYVAGTYKFQVNICSLCK